MKRLEPPLDHLHLGCGDKAPPGWLNVDGSWEVVLARHPGLKRSLSWLRLLPPKQWEVTWNTSIVRLDLAKPMPFPSASFQAVYSSHTLEHLYHEDALMLLKECHRVLKPQGICRVVVPDIESIVHRYVGAKERGDSNAAGALMEALYVHDKRRPAGLLGLYRRLTAFLQHKWMYDTASLVELFRLAGFTNPEVKACLESGIARIAEVEEPNRILNGEGIVVEARKE